MDLGDQSPEHRGWLSRCLAWLVGDDADWVLGDLEERRRKRHGVFSGLARNRDLVSVAIWALGRRRVRHGGRGMGGWTRKGREGALLDVLWQDIRYTIAALRRDFGFAAMTILTLAIGIGANTAVFSVVQSTLLKPLPYEDPDGLAMVWTDIPGEGVHEATSAFANIQDWKAQNRVFDDLATFDPATQTLTDGDRPEQVSTAYVSANLFSVLGVAPLAGRAFSLQEERQRASVVLLSYDLWQRRFGASPVVLGQTIEVNRTPFEVIGVMPEGFAFPEKNTRLWLPETLLAGWDDRAVQRGTDSWRVVGRLASGVSLGRAHSHMNEIADRLERAHPNENEGLDINVVPLFDQVTGYSFQVALWTLFAAAGLVLLIACANAAHLILARGMKRTQEFSLRVALGATTRRLIRLTLTEGLVISLASGVAGLLLAVGGLRVLITLAPANMPRLDELGIDTTVLIYATAVSVATGALFGIAPVVGRFGGNLYDGLREGRGTAQGGGRHRVRRLLVVVQLVFAIILVFGANLLVRSFMEVRSVDPGFQSENVLMANLLVESSLERVAFYEQVVENVRAIPGVRAAGIVEDLFISGVPNREITIEGQVSAEPEFVVLRIDAIAGEFFQSVGVPLREGRTFSTRDRAEAAPVAIINETMARRFWPEKAVGKRFRTGDLRAGTPWIEVVGVVGDMRRQGLERPPIAQVFRPYEQATSRGMNLLVRTDGPVPGLPEALRTKIAAIDRTVPLYRMTTVAEALDGYLLQRRFQTFLLGLFSAIALVLAAVGIYGLVQYSVSQRTREMGVRMALGAMPNRIVVMVLHQGFTLALIGLAVGMGLALWLSKAVSVLLFGTTAADLANVVVTTAILLITTLVACYVPARRAARIDPVAALRDW